MLRSATTQIPLIFPAITALCLGVVLMFAAGTARALDCSELQGAWQARMELKASGAAYSPEGASPMRANDALYLAYIKELLLAGPGREPCLVDDELVWVINSLAELLNGRITAEEFSAQLLAQNAPLAAIWELDAIVGQDLVAQQAFVDAYGDTPTFVVGDLLTGSIAGDTDAALQLWLRMLDNADGMYAEEFAAHWAPQLLREKPAVVLSRMDELAPYEQLFEESCCWGMLPEENEELAAIYAQHQDSAAAGIVLRWLACEEMTDP